MTPAGFPHSDIPGSQLGCQLPRAYRRLLRPSSALDAKASTMCPSQLATTNTTPHPPTITGRQRCTTHPYTRRPRKGPRTITREAVIGGDTLQRCSRPLSRSQTTTPHRPSTRTQPSRRSDRATENTHPPRPRRPERDLMSQNPNSVPPPPSQAST